MRLLRKVRRLTCIILALVNVAVVLALLVTGYAGLFNPARHPSSELLVLAFPIPFAINVAFLLFWLLFNYRYAIIPLLGFLFCWGPSRAYCPINFSSNDSKEGIKVASFNICCLTKAETSKTVDYLKNLKADILCLQEVPAYASKFNPFNEEMSFYPYTERVERPNRERICVYSKYPILKTEMLSLDSKRNNSAAFFLDVDGETVLLLNIHFETVGLKVTDREKIESIINQKEIDPEERTLFYKICESAAKRGSQVDLIVDYLKKYKTMPIILCGDFNDVPNSYAYRQIEECLQNCYKTAATGFGFTYIQNRMMVRIDNIFCSNEWETCSCHVDNKINVSDHYPIIAMIKKRTNP